MKSKMMSPLGLLAHLGEKGNTFVDLAGKGSNWKT
jgi:hypothetical protein